MDSKTKIRGSESKRIEKFARAQEIVREKISRRGLTETLVCVLACTMALYQEASQSYVSVEFEVFGKVQGVYFTKYCRDRSTELDIVGWVKNSKRGTIMGKMQGPKSNVEVMIGWLSNEGSPGSKIERCDLMNFEYLARKEFNGFSIRF